VKSIWIVAKNTFREIIRDRILYGLFVFAALLIGLSLALGQLSFAEQARIATNFGFAAMHLSAVILSIFVGSTLVAREIDKKTIFTLLVRPINRTQFLIGKVVGMMGVITFSSLLIGIVLVGILSTMGVNFNSLFVIGIYGVLLEAIVLLALTIFFGTFSSSLLSVSFVLGLFLIGHWLDSLKFFAEKSEAPEFIFFAKTISTIITNLEAFNWRALFTYNKDIPMEQLYASTGYALAWVLVLISVASLILKGRDLG
jgi:ABC-type transport system involved in multi-copper enzyme maturation permease subunit